MLKKILIGVIIIILIHQVYITYKYYTNEPIELQSTHVEDTNWRDQYLQLKEKIDQGQELTDKDNILVYKCLTNPFDITGNVQDNYLFVDVTDGCKSAKARFEIRAKEMQHLIIQAGFGWSFKYGYFIPIGCLYQINSLLAIGGGCIFPIKNYENIAVEILSQIKI